MTRVSVRTAGLVLAVETPDGAWTRRVAHALPGEGESDMTGAVPDVEVSIGDVRARLPGARSPLTRGAWSTGDGSVVLEDACGSGLDLLVTPHLGTLSVVARPHPGPQHRALALAAPVRTELLHRAALIQYPSLWWAGCAGRVPLHVSALSVAGRGVVLAGPAGVGKSTLVRDAVRDGAVPTSDNLCVVEGRLLHGLLEPTRVEGGTGRRSTHGRREGGWSRRRPSVSADEVLVLRRGTEREARLVDIPAEDAVRDIVAGTYAAGELRRYWGFAATLALGTGRGPAHPGVEAAARTLVRGARTRALVLPHRPGTRLAQLLDESAGCTRIGA